MLKRRPITSQASIRHQTINLVGYKGERSESVKMDQIKHIQQGKPLWYYGSCVVKGINTFNGGLMQDSGYWYSGSRKFIGNKVA